MRGEGVSTDVSGACFVGADLRGADLRGVIGLTREQLEEAILDDTTQLPVEFLAALTRNEDR